MFCALENHLIVHFHFSGVQSSNFAPKSLPCSPSCEVSTGSLFTSHGHLLLLVYPSVVMAGKSMGKSSKYCWWILQQTMFDYHAGSWCLCSPWESDFRILQVYPLFQPNTGASRASKSWRASLSSRDGGQYKLQAMNFINIEVCIQYIYTYIYRHMYT